MILRIIFIGASLLSICYSQTEGTKFSVSSYGEILFQHFDYGPNQKATLQGSKDDHRAIIDIPRLILGLKYNFLPDLYVETEIEFEHGGTGSALA